MARGPTFSSPFLLGFEDIERLIERAGKASHDGYPPYNIEAVDDQLLRITLAVAGFSIDSIEILLEDNQLVIRGRQPTQEGRTFLHRGIATRQFQKAFVLAEGMEVDGARLRDGLLSIDLRRPKPEPVVKKIAIEPEKTRQGETIDISDSVQLGKK